MINLYWYLDTTFGSDLALYGLLGLEIVAIIGLIVLFFSKSRLRTFLLTVFLFVNIVGGAIYVLTIGNYREFRQKYDFYRNHATDIAGNLDFYLASPVKFDDIALNVTTGGVDAVDVVLRCVTEAKNADCISLLDETVHSAATKSTASAPEGYIVPLKYQEVRQYLERYYETGTPAEQFYSARLLRQNYETDISFVRLQELRTLVPNDVPLPVQ